MEGHAGAGFEHSQVFEGLFFDLVQVFWCVFVLDGLDGEMEFAVGLVSVVESVCFRDVAVELFSDSEASLIGP